MQRVERRSIGKSISASRQASPAVATAVPVINALEQADRWPARGGGRCHLMADTGLNRLGIAPGEASDPRIAALDVAS
ncbi:MAG: alanine racemase, partial [Gemmatimonadota bacterium]